MAFLSGKLPHDDGFDDDEIEIDEQPTLPVYQRDYPTTTVDEAIARAKARIEAMRQMKRVCPLCVYYREQCGESVEVGAAQLRVCDDHARALQEADTPTRLTLHLQVRRAYEWYFNPHPEDWGIPGYPDRERLRDTPADWGTHDDGR